MELKEEVRRMMRDIRANRLPSSRDVVERAFEELGYGEVLSTPDVVRAEFNARLREVFEYALIVLERFEQDTYLEGIPDHLIERRPEVFRRAERTIEGSENTSEGLGRAFRQMFADLYPMLRQIFLSISQSRKTRGGSDFELAFGTLLGYAGIPYQRVPRQTRTDFMLPSEDAFNQNSNVTLVLSAKRTLRERWREVAEELFDLRSPNVYLITADEKVTRGHVEGICGRYRIHLVVWDSIKNDRFPDEPLVIGYSALANDVFPTFEHRWASL